MWVTVPGAGARGAHADFLTAGGPGRNVLVVAVRLGKVALRKKTVYPSSRGLGAVRRQAGLCLGEAVWKSCDAFAPQGSGASRPPADAGLPDQRAEGSTFPR